MPRICQYCGEEHNNKHYNALYCNPTCKAKGEALRLDPKYLNGQELFNMDTYQEIEVQHGTSTNYNNFVRPVRFNVINRR